MSKRTLLAVFVAGAISVVPATPASASGSDGLSNEAQKAASLDDLKATDAQLTEAIATLDKEVAAQQAAVLTAQQAVDAANQALQASDQALAQTQQQFDELRGEAREQAVEAYMRPQDDVVTHMLAADGFSDASRRAVILDEVSGQNADALDQVRATRSDLDRQRKDAVAARDEADRRRTAEQAKLDQLNAARADKARLDASLQARIADYAAEDAATAAPSAGPGDRASRGGGGGDDGGRGATAGVTWPLHGPHVINSPFGRRWGTMHKGVDLQASIGTQIYAAKGGVVTKAGWESGYGNYTCIDHGGGFSTCYGHQSKLGVSVGQHVNGGDPIGLTGNTGTSTGPHLHFETWVDGVPRDPIGILPG